jgi:hypothetical protein
MAMREGKWKWAKIPPRINADVTGTGCRIAVYCFRLSRHYTNLLPETGFGPVEGPNVITRENSTQSVAEKTAAATTC